MPEQMDDQTERSQRDHTVYLQSTTLGRQSRGQGKWEHNSLENLGVIRAL